MKKFKAALFDLDGVVFDTEPQYTLFWGEQCRLYHPEIPGLEHQIKGSTLQQIFDSWWTGPLEKERELVTQRLNDFESNMDFIYISGIKELISDLHAHQVRTAVVTSSNQPKMRSVYQKCPDFNSLFDKVLTSEDFAESKPSPDCYLRGAASFDVAPDDCIVFEDSFNGLKSGRSAGMFVVGLTTTNSKEDILSLSDIQLSDYTNVTYNSLNDFFLK